MRVANTAQFDNMQNMRLQCAGNAQVMRRNARRKKDAAQSQKRPHTPNGWYLNLTVCEYGGTAKVRRTVL